MNKEEREQLKFQMRVGYRWRDELVDRILPHMKDEIDPIFPSKRELLNNLVRGYVPIFFPTRLYTYHKGRWIFPDTLRLDSWWVNEIENIGRDFTEVGIDLNDNLVKPVFMRHKWEVDYPVEGISLLDKRGKWIYDAYKDRIAVEVELSSRTSIFKDAFKFLIGQAMDQIDVGVIIVREELVGKGKPYINSIERDSHPIHKTLPMLKIAFYAYPSHLARVNSK